MAVGTKRGDDPDILSIPDEQPYGVWSRLWTRLHGRLRSLDGRAAYRLRRPLRWMANPGALLDEYRGIENFRYPGSWRVLEVAPEPPDVVHCHNLHGSYFDLRVLPWLSSRVPTVLTLHDAWTLSGHCAHSFDCERWKTGCGQCPDLTIYPAVRKDATAYNWLRKRDIYTGSRLYIATASQWLMQKVEASILSSAAVETRVIPDGVDLSVFHPGDSREARSELRLPPDAKLVFLAGERLRTNVWRDYETARAAISRVSQRMRGQTVLCIALGEEGAPERVGEAEIRFVPYERDPRVVARYYRAADVYVHPARADTFPNAVIEAMACGTPVVATAVGGIPEQVEDGHTGYLVGPKDAESMASSLERLLSDDALRAAMGAEAAEVASSRFDLARQARAYLGWYREIVEAERSRRSTGAA